jgi:hypothetical protein
MTQMTVIFNIESINKKKGNNYTCESTLTWSVFATYPIASFGLAKLIL